MRFLYHLASIDDLRGDPYAPTSLASEGFIHASYVERVRESANLYFPAGAKLVVFRIDPRKLPCEVREVVTPRGPMPHIHGAIPRVAIDACLPAVELDETREKALEGRASATPSPRSSSVLPMACAAMQAAPSDTTPATSLALATHLELVEADAKRSLATEWEMIAGGCAAYGGPGSHVNQGVGMGLSEAISPDAANAIARFYARRREDARVELASFAVASSLPSLSAHGFILDELHHVLVCPLRALSTENSELATAADASPDRRIVIERLDASDEAQVRAYVRVAASGFLPEGEEVPETFYTTGLAAARWDGASSFLARVGDQIVGAAGSVTKGGITSLFGTSVLPGFRRRGIQQALMAARLADGRAKGAFWATVTSLPGGPTERNAVRVGFTLAYARVVLLRRHQPEA